ncbi:MAG: hypothetical protein JXA72_01165 [Bacteroidales bacterium]|nr:hypothetical protein [Bacteroidales bacterium]
MKHKILKSGISILLFTAVFGSVIGYAQEQSTSRMFTAELNVKFDGMEIKKLERAAKMLSDAEAMLHSATSQYDALTDLQKKERISSEYNAAMKLLLESSRNAKEANSIVFYVFKLKNESFWNKMNRSNHRAAGMEKARYYQGTALKSYNRSLIRRQQAEDADRFDYALAIMKDAMGYEKLAVRDQGRSLQICTDYPVEYNYGWEDDLSLEEVVKIMKDPNVHEPPKDIFATVDKETAVDSSLLKEVIFKVQIAAHTMPLSEEYLNLIYKDKIPIDMIYEDNWYKYSIGRYKTFEEAEATLIETNIKKAFVVAYSEGKKMSTQEALELIEKRKAANE